MTKVATLSVEAIVDGINLGVQGATITLGINAIPTIELMCAPSKDGPSEPLKPKVFRPTIKDFSDIYDSLAKRSYGLGVKGDVDISVNYHTGESDSVKLERWILSGVGLSSVSATAAPHLSVVLQHPICNLTKTGSVYETAKADEFIDLNEFVAGSETFMDVVNHTYSFYRDYVEYLPSANKFPEMFTKNLGVGICNPFNYLVDGMDCLFLSKGKSEDMSDRIAQAMARYVIPTSGGSSTWDMFVRMSGPLMYSIVQEEGTDYTGDMLLIEPTQPWKSPSIDINEEECFWTELPGVDPFRIIGVMASKLGPGTGPISQGQVKNGTVAPKDEPTGEVMYAPVDDLSEFDGRIIMTSAPPVLVSAFGRDAAYGEEITAGNTKGAAIIEDGYNDILEKYCKALYDISAGSMVQARLQMPLSFRTRTGGKMVLPGNRCRFRSEGKTIYGGYINKVVHTMWTSGECSTTVSMSHVSPPGGFFINRKLAIPEGTKNEAYE